MNATLFPLPTADRPVDQPAPDVCPHDNLDDWRWWDADENRDAVIVATQLATAVYENRRGDIVIRQSDPSLDEDQFIYLRPEYVRALIAKLEQLVR